MKTIFMNTKNRSTNGPHKCLLKLSQRLELRSSNKHVTLQSLSIYYTWKTITKQHKNKKLKIIFQHGMMSLNYQMLPVPCQIFKIIANISLKNIKHEQKLLLFMFTSIE